MLFNSDDSRLRDDAKLWRNDEKEHETVGIANDGND